MSRLAIITLPLAGHINPMSAVARELARRGHELIVIGPEGLCQLTRQTLPEGKTHILADADYPPGRLDSFLGLLPTIRGLRGIRAVIDEIAELSALYLRHLPTALRDLQVDAVIADQLEPAAGLIARALALPHASLACALPMNREAHLPPPYLGWPYRDSIWWRSLYGGGYLVIDRMMAPQGRHLIEAARHYGLEPSGVPGDWASEICDLSQCLPGFDYPREKGPAPLGPWRDRTPAAPLDLERDGRPLIFCSFGTIMGGRRDLFERVARACASLDVQCAIAHGGRLTTHDEAGLRALPGRPIVRDFIDYETVFKIADGAILHGGLNAVLDALSEGVPIIVLPLAFEQAAIGGRVVQSGAGTMLRRPTERRLSDALSHILHDPSVRKSAENMARAKAGGTRAAADRIEAILHPPEISQAASRERRQSVR